MSDLTLRRCNICLSEFVSLHQMLFFQCGHKACRSCCEQSTYRKDPLCAECRKPKGNPHRIYLSLDDLVDEPTTGIIDHLNGINTESSAESIVRASEKMKRLPDRSGSDDPNPSGLLAAAKNLEERLAPLATRYEKLKKENQKLLDRLQQRNSELAEYKDKLRDAKEEIRKHKHEAERHHETAQIYLAANRKKDSEISALHQKLAERVQTENLLNTKLKALAKSQKRASRHPAPDADTSLHIEGMSEIAVTKPPKRLPSSGVLQELNSPLSKPTKRRKRVVSLENTPNEVVQY